MKIEKAEKLCPEQFRKELMKKKLLKLVENKNNKEPKDDSLKR